MTTWLAAYQSLRQAVTALHSQLCSHLKHGDTLPVLSPLVKLVYLRGCYVYRLKSPLFCQIWLSMNSRIFKIITQTTAEPWILNLRYLESYIKLLLITDLIPAVTTCTDDSPPTILPLWYNGRLYEVTIYFCPCTFSCPAVAFGSLVQDMVPYTKTRIPAFEQINWLWMQNEVRAYSPWMWGRFSAGLLSHKRSAHP